MSVPETVKCYEGMTTKFLASATDDDGAAVDLTGATVYFFVADKFGLAENTELYRADSVTDPSVVVITDAAGGLVEITVPHTESLPAGSFPVGEYAMDVQAVQADTSRVMLISPRYLRILAAAGQI